MGILHKPFSYRFYETIQNLAATLAAGITSVRDAAGADAGSGRPWPTGWSKGRGSRSR